MYQIKNSVSIAIITLFVCMLNSVQSSNNKNILFFHLAPSSSHRSSIWPLAEKLVDKGYNITYIFPLPPEHRLSHVHPKIREIVPSKLLPLVKEYLTDFDINLRLNHSVNQFFFKIFQNSVSLCEALYESPEIRELLDNPGNHYDLILIDGGFGECANGLVWRFKAKHILFYPHPAPGWIWDAHGFLPESASVPEVGFYNTPEEMQSFWNRVKATLSIFLCRLGQLEYIRRLTPALRKVPGMEEIPDMLEFERNTSLVLVNSYIIEDYPLSLPPMIQSYSGLWCSKEKLLITGKKLMPPDIAKFVEGDGKVEGIVYVSFGSSVDPSSMPDSIKNQFFAAFEKFPKIRFLWRWGNEKVPDNLPKNVLLRKWFPQQDILRHPKIRAFITQAGRPSTQEALCWGVPMIAIPIMADQDFNAVRLEHIGVAIKLDIETITASALQSAISSMVSDSNPYKTQMTQMSLMFQDRPMDPLENVVYWTEYVLRYNNTHIKPLGRNHTWWQRRLLDVYLFFGMVVVGIGILLGFLIKLCVCRLCCKNRKKDKRD